MITDFIFVVFDNMSEADTRTLFSVEGYAFADDLRVCREVRGTRRVVINLYFRALCLVKYLVLKYYTIFQHFFSDETLTKSAHKMVCSSVFSCVFLHSHLLNLAYVNNNKFIDLV